MTHETGGVNQVILEIDEIRQLLADRRIDIVARETGVSASTIARIRSGERLNPKYETIRALSEYFARRTGNE